MSLSREAVIDALKTVAEPELGGDLVSRGMIGDVEVKGGKVGFTVLLTTPACPLKAQIEADCRAAVARVPGVEEVSVSFRADVPVDARTAGKLPEGVRNIIAVASGKGGVGKSTVSVNLAAAWAESGVRVGLLDGDMYGPNIPLMLGLAGKRATAEGEKLLPNEAFGVKVVSVGLLASPDQPLVWRGPMLHSTVRQLLFDAAWGELDYMLVDLPPGTGDVLLSLAQTVPLAGAVMVTTPQEASVADVIKGAAAFEALGVPILGVVENMSGFVCPHCGKNSDIFGRGGGEEFARKAGAPWMGRIPIDPAVREGGDSGNPVVVGAPDTASARAFRELAAHVAARVSVMHKTAPAAATD